MQNPIKRPSRDKFDQHEAAFWRWFKRASKCRSAPALRLLKHDWKLIWSAWFEGGIHALETWNNRTREKK